MSRTMEALGSWMSSNRLRLNPHKTQFIWLGTCQQLAKLDMVALTSAFPHFTFSSTVRDLGVTLDQELTLAPHIHSLCRACYYQLRKLRTVSRSLTSTAAATLVHLFVTSRLDYCSSLYISLPATRLNCVLRSAARLIGWVSKFDHISAYMQDVLHWLPLRQRIEFRVAVLVWYSLIGQAPAYLTDLCCPSLSARSTRHLCSAEQGLLSHVSDSMLPMLLINLSHLLAPPPCRARPSPWLAIWYGMVSHWLSGHFLEYSPKTSFSNLKQHYSAALGLGALLSSPT